LSGSVGICGIVKTLQALTRSIDISATSLAWKGVWLGIPDTTMSGRKGSENLTSEKKIGKEFK